MLLGTYEVQGPGIEITLTDNNTGISKDGMEVIDCGVAVLSMHAPYEATSKIDVYEAKRCYVAFLNAPK